jgi:hypothetical protein
MTPDEFEMTPEEVRDFLARHLGGDREQALRDAEAYMAAELGGISTLQVVTGGVLRREARRCNDWVTRRNRDNGAQAEAK